MTDPLLPGWAVLLGIAGLLMMVASVGVLALIVWAEFNRARAPRPGLYPNTVPYDSVFDIPAYIENGQN